MVVTASRTGELWVSLHIIITVEISWSVNEIMISQESGAVRLRIELTGGVA